MLARIQLKYKYNDGIHGYGSELTTPSYEVGGSGDWDLEYTPDALEASGYYMYYAVRNADGGTWHDITPYIVELWPSQPTLRSYMSRSATWHTRRSDGDSTPERHHVQQPDRNGSFNETPSV